MEKINKIEKVSEDLYCVNDSRYYILHEKVTYTDADGFFLYNIKFDDLVKNKRKMIFDILDKKDIAIIKRVIIK